ncbi:hypothetical protein BDQ12DRAFT_6632 [Crucibulum laeve]|uniref:Uncharacterized protein n=1 Tax=Crucibulum laeve TaxID=68775 RepID=A0A5C3MH31_9AGAR|nr:hypothetical protein BDQ12DRAFT_6632 [Crucibulum laeve]
MVTWIFIQWLSLRYQLQRSTKWTSLWDVSLPSHFSKPQLILCTCASFPQPPPRHPNTQTTNMNRFRKAAQKIFRKSSGEGVADELTPRQKLRHSRSMPMRSSNETDDSYYRPRPVYRGDRPLKTADIQAKVLPGVMDISHGAAKGVKDVAQASANEQGFDYEEDEFSLRLTYHLDDEDSKLLDKFPLPPHEGYPHEQGGASLCSCYAGRIRAPTVDPTDLLPPPPLGVFELTECERHRSTTSAKLCGQPTIEQSAYPTARARYDSALDQYEYARSLPRVDQYGYLQPPPCQCNNKRPPITQYQARSLTTHRNYSTQSLGGQAALRSGPVSHRPLVHQLSHSTPAQTTQPLRVRKASNISNASRAYVTAAPVYQGEFMPIVTAPNKKMTKEQKRAEKQIAKEAKQTAEDKMRAKRVAKEMANNPTPMFEEDVTSI